MDEICMWIYVRSAIKTKTEMEQELRDYIVKELRFTSHPKYYKYIDGYVSNLTPIQVEYWRAWKDGKKTIW